MQLLCLRGVATRSGEGQTAPQVQLCPLTAQRPKGSHLVLGKVGTTVTPPLGDHRRCKVPGASRPRRGLGQHVVHAGLAACLP